MKKLTIAVDFDDVLADCNRAALIRANQKYGMNLSIEDITSWGRTGNDTDRRLEYFESLNFFDNQEMFPGAKAFIRALTSSPNRDVLIVTAIQPPFMLARAQKILKELPEIKPENITMASRKELVKADVLLDDNPDNILHSIADYRVLFRRPWNQHLTGMLSVNNYDEFLSLIERIEQDTRPSLLPSGPLAISLVGPSGSGKTAIASELAKSPLFAVPVSCTTRCRRDGESETAYHFMSKQEFSENKAKGCFLETTAYAGENYGMQREEIEKIWDRGQHAVMPVDICGANAMATAFGRRALSVFVYRPRREVIKEILSRNTSNDEKLNRLISLDNEYSMQGICDRVLYNDRELQDAVQMLLNMVTEFRGE